MAAPILVAEDEETDVALLRLAFEKAGLVADLVVAHDGQEVVDYFSSTAEPDGSPRRLPGLVLLDLKMPRMGGLEVLAWLHSQPRLKDLPVLIFTSSSHELDSQRALDMGAREYLVKPHALHDLVKLLRELHARYFDSAISS
jgi:CheY-like chemotaxis protein